jgi:F-type H+-transporting ATPase subunit b
MLFLADFSVMNPSFGLLFWTTIVFILVWFVLGKLAFKPIAKALQEREQTIDDALHAAEKARKEIIDITSGRDKLLEEARIQRIQIVNEAQALRDRIIEEAKVKAEDNARKLLDAAKEETANRRAEMEISLYNEIGKISLSIARQIIQSELKGNHDEFVTHKVEEFKKQRFSAKS